MAVWLRPQAAIRTKRRPITLFWFHCRFAVGAFIENLARIQRHLFFLLKATFKTFDCKFQNHFIITFYFRKLSKTHLPTQSASFKARISPSSSRFFSLHSSRCFSEQKKSKVLQIEVHIRTEYFRPTHTAIPWGFCPTIFFPSIIIVIFPSQCGQEELIITSCSNIKGIPNASIAHIANTFSSPFKITSWEVGTPEKG